MGAAANTCSLWAPNSPSSGAQELPLLPPGRQPRLQESTEGQPRSTEKASDCRASRGPGQRLGRGGLHAGESQAQQAMRRGQPTPARRGLWRGNISLLKARGEQRGPRQLPRGLQKQPALSRGLPAEAGTGVLYGTNWARSQEAGGWARTTGGGHAQERHHRAGQAGSPCPAGGGSRRGPSVSFLKMLRASLSSCLNHAPPASPGSRCSVTGLNSGLYPQKYPPQAQPLPHSSLQRC